MKSNDVDVVCNRSKVVEPRAFRWPCKHSLSYQATWSSH